MAKFGLGHIVNGMLGNMSETSTQELKEKYGSFLLPEEKITNGFVLIRDVVIFTDIRIIYVNKKDVTGKKTNFQSIYLMNIVDIEVETAGFGIDDSDIIITSLATVQRRPFEEKYHSIKLEFPKSFKIDGLYQYLEGLAYHNRLEINQMATD